MKDKALALLSIAAKAGKIVSGGFMCEKAIQEGTACLIIIAEDASGNTRKKFTDKSTFYNVPCRVAGTSEVLGHRIGKQNRMVVAVTDEGLAEQITNKLDS
ncbi:MAG: 50S ribosomal protein L7ae [Lachnospiraceae bacterium]|nr:50S ribosomal protein L7ae [Lachnospiraceae bacterium]